MFVSGCNVVLYNLKTKEQQFLIRKNNRRAVTHISVGTHKTSQNKLLNITDRDKDIKEKVEPLICIAEFSDKEDLFYITIIKPFANNIQYTIKSTEKKWKIKFSTILNDSPYCVTISQKMSNSIKTPILSKIKNKFSLVPAINKNCFLVKNCAFIKVFSFSCLPLKNLC